MNWFTLLIVSPFILVIIILVIKMVIINDERKRKVIISEHPVDNSHINEWYDGWALDYQEHPLYTWDGENWVEEKKK